MAVNSNKVVFKASYDITIPKTDRPKGSLFLTITQGEEFMASGSITYYMTSEVEEFLISLTFENSRTLFGTIRPNSITISGVATGTQTNEITRRSEPIHTEFAILFKDNLYEGIINIFGVAEGLMCRLIKEEINNLPK